MLETVLTEQGFFNCVIERCRFCGVDGLKTDKEDKFVVKVSVLAKPCILNQKLPRSIIYRSDAPHGVVSDCGLGRYRLLFEPVTSWYCQLRGK